MTRHYWGYRIDTNRIDFFTQELKAGRLRQGWGYDSGQDLRILSYDNGASRNLYIFNKVKKGDILLIPRCPSWNEVAIAEATEDFDKGYDFAIDPKFGDYGHIFPVKFIKSFVRANKNVSSGLKSSLKCKCRYWCMDDYATDIEELLSLSSSLLKNASTCTDNYYNIVNESFNYAFSEEKFVKSVVDSMMNRFQAAEWELVILEGLRKLLPSPIMVEHTGGPNEIYHGCDIMIHYPGLLGDEYIVGIQIKDYIGDVSTSPIDQVCKIDNYFKDDPIHKIIDKIVIITKAEKCNNLDIEKYAKEKNVKVIFAGELEKLLSDMAKAPLGLSVR